MRLLILGHAEHGKDTFAEELCKVAGLRFVSSSRFALERFLYDRIKGEFGYSDIEECWEDRRRSQTVRDRWAAEISNYNRDDPCRLMREIYADHDIYVGLRCRKELCAAKKERLFDLSIWVDASERKPPEGKTSMTVVKEDADYVMYNNDTEEELIRKVNALACLFP